MRSRIHIAKSALVIGIAIGLAVLSGVHALSSTNVRTSPELSLAIWSSNGLALERLAYRAFFEDIRRALGERGKSSSQRTGQEPAPAHQTVNNELLERSASVSSPVAARALTYDPLRPKAHAILALAQIDHARKMRIIALASHLDRRDLLLQSLVLQSRVDVGDYAGAIETLDQILRVHPQREGEFFQPLTAGLKQETAIPAFRQLLGKRFPWRDNFLRYAASDALAARNLAVIRETLDFGSPLFDKTLIASLVRNGDVGMAERVYGQLQTSSSPPTGTAWSTAYPPFDWKLADSPGLLVQLSQDGRNLEFATDPGSGGVLASKLIASPAAPFAISVEYRIANQSLAKDLKLRLTCFGQNQPLFETSFSEIKGRIEVTRNPNCRYIYLDLIGRSWSGGGRLSGLISSVLINPR